jgi:hypothetical protein
MRTTIEQEDEATRLCRVVRKYDPSLQYHRPGDLHKIVRRARRLTKDPVISYILFERGHRPPPQERSPECQSFINLILGSP